MSELTCISCGGPTSASWGAFCPSCSRPKSDAPLIVTGQGIYRREYHARDLGLLAAKNGTPNGKRATAHGERPTSNVQRSGGGGRLTRMFHVEAGETVRTAFWRGWYMGLVAGAVLTYAVIHLVWIGGGR